jgi:signal transduction histidine kinase
VARKRLLFRALLFVLPIMVLSLAVTGFILSWTSYQSFRQTIRQDYTSMIKSSAGEIRAFLGSAKTGIEGLAGVLAATKVDAWQQEMALTAFHHIATQFVSLALEPHEGQEPIAVGQRLGDAEIEQLEVHREAVAGRLATSRVMVTKEHIPYIYLATPVMRLGRVSQVLVAELNLKAVWDVLEGIHIGETGMVYLLDDTGRLVGHREIDRVIKALPGVPSEILQRLQEPPGTLVEWSERRPDGSWYCLGYDIPGVGWFIVLSQKEREIYGYLYENFWLALAITLFMCFITGLLTWSRVRRFLRPVQTLHREVQKFGRGELDQRVPIESEDEIGELGTAFNEMADSLKQFIARELETARELAQARNLATLGAASSKVTHEVGNLLNNLGATLLILKSDPLSAGSKKAVEIMERDAVRVRTFIQNFLQFAKKPELTLQRASLEGTLRELLYVSQARAESKGIEVHLDWPADLPPVPVDLGLIHQVFNNLLKNAIEAMDGGGRLDIAARVDRDCLEVRIADSGPGISPEVKERIFDPFFTTKGKQGTGLGLAIGKTIVEAHRGTIACESEPGCGTAFILSLPLK